MGIGKAMKAIFGGITAGLGAYLAALEAGVPITRASEVVIALSVLGAGGAVYGVTNAPPTPPTTPPVV